MDVEMECVQIDLDNICRTCKSDSPEMKSLYYRDSESGKENLRLDEMLMALASVQVNKDDELPKLICRPCYVLLKNAYAFKKQCEKADAFLREHLKKVSVSEETLLADLEFLANTLDDNSLEEADMSQDNEESEEIISDSEIYTDQVAVMDMDNVEANYSQVSDNQVEVDVAQETNEFFGEENASEMLLKNANHKEEIAKECKSADIETDKANDFDSNNSTNSEYVPMEQPPEKIKECEGRPLKCQISQKLNEKPSGHPPPKQKPNTRLEPKQKRIQCPECNVVFTSVRLLEKHAKQHQASQKTRIVYKKAGVNEEIYRCDHCTKTFTTERYKNFHMKLHLEATKHQCETCKKIFTRKSHLTEHMKFHDESSKSFLCAECGLRFTRNDHLIIHMRRHRGETIDLTVHKWPNTGKSSCDVCGKTFVRAYCLAVHMKKHRGEKPYRCTYCAAAFTQDNQLKIHIQKHTNKESVQCDLSMKKNLAPSSLTSHQQINDGINDNNMKPLNSVNEINHEAVDYHSQINNQIKLEEIEIKPEDDTTDDAHTHDLRLTEEPQQAS